MVIIDPADIWRSLLRTLVPPRSQPKPHWLRHHNRLCFLLNASTISPLLFRRAAGVVGGGGAINFD